MKGCYWLVLALPLVAAEPDDTTWYDSEGQVVLVESANAEPAEVPFVAEWRQREIDRRERYSGTWSSEIWPVWGGDYFPRRRSLYNGYRARHGHYPGIRVRGSHYGGGGYYRPCSSGSRGGATVIIRW
ncbi:hypothetical protein [Haloferula sp.]|uniref:hypothetical protein n=1 Tax=Haloferula sp. TaxID=2497595 RepID=UPI00329DE804